METNKRDGGAAIVALSLVLSLTMMLCFAVAVVLFVTSLVHPRRDARNSAPRSTERAKLPEPLIPLASSEDNLSRAKAEAELAQILYEKAEGLLWAARLGEEAKNVCVSWYGKPYHGRTAASGIVYDMNARHIAHRWLPFGTKVSFYNPLTGAFSWGTVVDRGPFIDGRHFDLSRSMADELGILDVGVALVRCWIPEMPGEFLGLPSTGD